MFYLGRECVYTCNSRDILGIIGHNYEAASWQITHLIQVRFRNILTFNFYPYEHAYYVNLFLLTRLCVRRVLRIGLNLTHPIIQFYSSFK